MHPQQQKRPSPERHSALSLLEDALDAPDLGLGIFDSELRLTEFNRRFQKLRGYPANLCEPGVPLRDLLSHDLAHGQLAENDADDPVDAWLQRAAARRRHAAEDVLADGRVIATTLAPLGDHDMLLMFADVTERSRAERALRANKEWLDLVTDASSEGIYDWDIKTNDLKVSYRLTAMLGLDPGNLTSNDWADRVHPEDFDDYRAALTGHFKGETPHLKCVYRIRRDAGDYIWFSDSGKCVRDESGRAIRLVGAVADITAQKLAEASLMNSEQRYALAMRAINEGVYDWDIEHNEIYYSEGVRTALGLDPDRLKTVDDWFKRIHEEDTGRWRAALVDHFKGKTDRFECEFRYRGPGGGWRWARQHGIAQFNDEGRAVRMIGATGDITELKEHRAAADEARAHLAMAIESISEGFALYDAGERLVLCNAQYRNLHGGLEDVLRPGVRHEDVLRAAAERNVLVGVGEDVEDWVQGRLAAYRNPGQPYDSQLGDGRWVKVAWRRTSDGGIVGVFSDITEIKNAEIALRESEARYALAMDGAHEALWDWDVASGTIFIAPRLARDLGLTLDRQNRVAVDVWRQRIHPDDVAIFEDALRRHLRGEADSYTCEFRALDARGDYVWLYHRGVGLRDEKGRVYRMAGSAADITEKKLAQENLRQSEERYALATEAATEGLYDWDVAADRLIVSERLGAIISLPSGALNSMEWNDRVHPGDQSRYRAAIRDHFKGATPYLSCEYRIRAGDGDFIWVADNATSVRNADGRVVRLVGAIADVTGRKRAEEELREAKQRAEDAGVLAMEKARTLEALSTKLSKYLSPQVYSSIFSGQQSVEIDAKRKKLTIFFSDIVGFTSIADDLESEELTGLLNEYLTEMSRIALEHGATIDKFIGDAILAFFGDPESKGPKADAVACVKMAIAMQRRLQEMQGQWREIGLDRTFELRIGITTGFCTVGNFGSEDRMDYTVVGNEVNRAARLQSHAETGGILLSSETYALAKDEILAVDQGPVALKGIPRPVRAYKVMGIYDELVESGQVIRLDQPGMHLLVNPGELTDEGRAEALKALEQAAARLK
jgi:adenylate cyclase